MSNADAHCIIDRWKLPRTRTRSNAALQTNRLQSPISEHCTSHFSLSHFRTLHLHAYFRTLHVSHFRTLHLHAYFRTLHVSHFRTLSYAYTLISEHCTSHISEHYIYTLISEHCTSQISEHHMLIMRCMQTNGKFNVKYVNSETGHLPKCREGRAQG